MGQIIGLESCTLLLGSRVLQFEDGLFAVAGIEDLEPSGVGGGGDEAGSVGRLAFEDEVGILDGFVKLLVPEAYIGHQCIDGPDGCPSLGLPGGVKRLLGGTETDGGCQVLLDLGDNLCLAALRHIVFGFVGLVGLQQQRGVAPVSHDIEIGEGAQPVGFTEMGVHLLFGIGGIVALGLGGIGNHAVGIGDNLVESLPVGEGAVGRFDFQFVEVVGRTSLGASRSQFAEGDEMGGDALSEVIVTGIESRLHVTLRLPHVLCGKRVFRHDVQVVVAGGERECSDGGTNDGLYLVHFYHHNSH